MGQPLNPLDTVRRIWRLGRSSHAGSAAVQFGEQNEISGSVDFCELRELGPQMRPQML